MSTGERGSFTEKRPVCLCGDHSGHRSIAPVYEDPRYGGGVRPHPGKPSGGHPLLGGGLGTLYRRGAGTRRKADPRTALSGRGRIRERFVPFKPIFEWKGGLKHEKGDFVRQPPVSALRTGERGSFRA